jgi:hypothetical protein
MAAVGIMALALVLAGTAIGATLQKNGGPVTAVRTATADDQVSISVGKAQPDPIWVNVPGMAVTVTVPSGESGLLLITFSAQSQCNGTPGNFCYVRVLVDGNVAQPGPIVFDSTDDGPYNSVNSYEANSMQFVAGPKRAGTHSVRVQYGFAPFASAGFTLTARTLTVLRSRV